MLGGSKQSPMHNRRERKQGSNKRLSQTCLWVSVCPLQRHGSAAGQGLGLQQSWKSWRVAQVLVEEVAVSPAIEPLTRWPTNWRTVIRKRFHTVAEVLGPTTGFSTWGSGKGTENPQEIWLWRAVGFDSRTPTGLGKERLLEGTNRTMCIPGPGRKELWSRKRLSPTCLRVFGSLWCRLGSTVVCFRVRDTDCTSPGRHDMLAWVLLEEVPVTPS